MNAEEIRTTLQTSAAEELHGSGFQLLQAIAQISADPERHSLAQELIIRALERADAFTGYSELLYALVRRHGLFPYLDPDQLDLSDLFAYEVHRPVDLDDGSIVFHRIQALVYRRLLEGQSVILSAPTSFGKSLVIDAIVATGRLANIVVIVPTIALMDETRRRLARFRTYKLITHPSQVLAERNIIVMTQERLLEMVELPAVNLFMIDEFYKLDIESESDRASLLNQAMHRLYRTGAPYYLTGPNVRQLADSLPETFDVNFIATDYATVAADVVRIPDVSKDNEAEELVALHESLDGPTLIYCSSPRRVRDAARWLMGESNGARAPEDGYLAALSRWIGETYHPDWLVREAVESRIGLHHGRMPRALAQELVRSFNDGELHTLICTSTLIEGVNTRAKNVIILDNRAGSRRAFDYFTFNNIKGRSGRMFQHFVGRVFLFHEPPEANLPTVDIPVFSQSGKAPASLLLQLDRDELNEASEERVKQYYDQILLSMETLKANNGVNPEDQLRLAAHLAANPDLESQLSWRSAFPTYEAMATACNLITEYIAPTPQWRQHGARSSAQLQLLLSRLSTTNGDPKVLIQNYLDFGRSRGTTPDDAVEDALDFIRFWPGHHFPKRLMALQRIAGDIYGWNSGSGGNFAAYAARAESLFLPPYVADLEEYGLPASVSSKFINRIGPYSSLDELLARIRQVDVSATGLTDFEAGMLTRMQEGL